MAEPDKINPVREPRKRALVVPFNYQQIEERFNEWLEAGINDAEGVIKMLKMNYGYREEDIEFVHDEQGPLNNTTSEYIRDKLGQLIRTSIRDDEVFVYLNGHGNDHVNDDEEPLGIYCSSAYRRDDGGILTAEQINACLDELLPGVSFVLLIDACYVGGLVDRLTEQFDKTVSRGMADLLHDPVVPYHQERAGVTFYATSSKFQESFQYDIPLENGETRHMGLTNLFVYVVQEKGGKVTKSDLLKDVCEVKAKRQKEFNAIQNPALFTTNEQCNEMFLRGGRWPWQYILLMGARWIAVNMFAASFCSDEECLT